MKTAHQNAPTPQQNQDTANKAYVDSMGGISGVELKHQPQPGNGPLPSMQFQELAVTPSGLRVYVGGQGSQDSLWYFLTATNQWDTAAPQPVPILNVARLCFNASGSKLYVISNAAPTVISIVDTVTNTVTGTVSGLPGGTLIDMKILPVGGELWAVSGSSLIYRVDTTTDSFIASFSTTASNPNRLTFNPSGTKAYLIVTPAFGFGPRLVIFDTSTYSPINTINDTPFYRNLVALPDGSEVWVSSDGTIPNGEILRVSTTTDSFVGSPMLISQSGSAWQLLAKSDSSRVYALLNSGDIDVITVSSHTVTATVAMLGDYAGEIAINPTSTLIYASKTQGTQPYWVKVVNLTTNLVTATIESGSVPQPAPTIVGTFTDLRIAGAAISDDGGGQGSIALPFVFDTAAVPYTNIKANRPSYFASQTDPTKSGIVNLGSGSSARGNNATVGGGINNIASGEESCVPGGGGNLASGFAAFASGGSQATGDYSTAMGGSTAAGEYSVAMGNGANATGQDSVATSGCGATGDNSLAMGGYGSQASGLTATAIGGYGQTATGAAAFACGGFGSLAQGDGSFAANQGFADGANSASFSDSRSKGDSSFAANSGQADGLYAAAFGFGFTGLGANFAFATGDRSNATRITQRSHASGRFGANGDAQESTLVMRGSTPGVGVGESTELVLPAQFVLEDNKAYAIVVSGVVRGLVSGSPSVQTFKRSYAVRRTTGLTTIAASGTLEQLGDAASASWTLVASVGAGPDRFALTFNTGTTTSAARVVAKVEFVEVLN